MNYRQIARMMAAALLMAVIPATVMAQDYYDDDIYYSPKKEKEKQQKAAKAREQQTAAARGEYYNPTLGSTTDFPASDTYTVNSGSTIDVDTYNRRGQFLVPDSVASESIALDDFVNTRRIERFYNPEIVSASGDEELIDYYAASPAATGCDINVYVMDTYPYWGNPFRSPYSWSYAYGPSWGWGPSWSWGWGYDPWFDPYWSWNWGWGGPAYWPGYYPPYPGYYPPYPGWGGPSHAWRPSTGPGSSRPHYPSAGASSTASRRPSSDVNGIPASSSRPGGLGSGYRGRGHSTVGTSRPGSASGSFGRPQQGQRPAGTSIGGERGTRGRNGSATRPGSSSNSSRRSSGYDSGSSRSYDNSSRNSYNSSGSFHSSGGGFSGGSRSGGGGGGSRGRH